MKLRVPACVWWLAASAVVVSLVPALSRRAIYDRDAVLNGELWRFFTAPLVHFTLSHLAYDTLALFLAGTLIQWRGYRGLGSVCVLTSLASGFAVLCFEPELEFYGGLSGVATGAVVFVALRGLWESGTWRWICMVVLVAAIGKILFEVTFGTFAFLAVGTESFGPVPLCHVAGALTAATASAWQRYQSERGSNAVCLVIN